MCNRAVLPTLSALLSLASCERHGGDKVTRPILTTPSDARPDGDPPAELHDRAAPRPALPPATVPADRGYLQRHADAARDGRLGVRLAAGAYRVRWQAALQEAPPLAVLTAGDRAVIETRDGWQLFGLDGQSRGHGAHANDSLLLDPAHGVLYASHPSGMFAGWALADAKLAFAFSTRQAAGFQRDPIARRGPALLLASTEQPVMAETARRPDVALLELQDLGAPMKLDPRGAVMTAREAAALPIHGVPIAVAAAPDTVVVAAPDRLLFADPTTLRVTKQVATPPALALSVDEAGHAHLIVRTATGAALWIIAPDGARLARVDLAAVPDGPPVLGFDHAIHLVAGSRIVTLSPDGQPRWTATLESAIAGAVALPGGDLLVAAGPDALAFGPAGARRVLHHFEAPHGSADVRLTTAPVLTATGELLVASDRQLFCLAP